jgi:hypothetical protein
MSNNKADGSYLPPLAEPAPQAEGPVPRDWYAKVSRGLDELQRAAEERDLVIAMPREPEQERAQAALLLMPSPSRSKH